MSFVFAKLKNAYFVFEKSYNVFYDVYGLCTIFTSHIYFVLYFNMKKRC